MLDPVELFPEIPNLYEFPSIHAGMLYDEERVGKYCDAIWKVVRKGDTVADIGTGTGLLAFLCARAGAARVHAIERSPAIRWAKIGAEKNSLGDKITFHNKDSRLCTLPKKVDVVVSELIGHLAFEEGMVESLFDARNRLLVTGGKMVPMRVDLKVALVEENEIYPECVDCWKPIRGIDYSFMREDSLRAFYITSLNDRCLLSEPMTFFTVDFINGEKPASREKKNKSLSVVRSGVVNGICFWFDALLADDVRLSSGPWSRTHWKQCFAPIAEPIPVTTGDRISVDIEMNLRIESDNEPFKFRCAAIKEA